MDHKYLIINTWALPELEPQFIKVRDANHLCTTLPAQIPDGSGHGRTTRVVDLMSGEVLTLHWRDKEVERG